MEINPAILTASLSQFKEQLALVKDLTDCEVIQIDVIDAIFTTNVTLSPTDLVLAALDFNDLQLDFHLMTEEPMDYVWELIEQAPQIPVRAVYGQIEKMSHQPQFLEEVKKQDWQAGLALDLFTPIESIEAESWEWLDGVLLMAVEAGAQGQKLNNLIWEKVEALQAKARAMNRPLKIAVDGGVKAEHLKQLADLKVDRVAIGSALFSAPDFSEAFNNLKENLNG